MIEIKDINYERAVLVGLVTPYQDEKKLVEYLDELEFLAQTAGAVVEKRFSQKLDMPNPRTFVGAGKLEEIKQYIDEHGSIDVVIFDDELSSGQLRNIERELQIKILDHSTNTFCPALRACGHTLNAKGEVSVCAVPVKRK